MRLHRLACGRWLPAALFAGAFSLAPWCATRVAAQQETGRPVGVGAAPSVLRVPEISGVAESARATLRSRGTLARTVRPSRSISVATLFPPAAVRRTHWFEGGLIGAAVLGVSVGVLANGMCDADSGTNCSTTVPTVTVAAAALGWVVGALIGGQIRKAEHDAGATSYVP